MITGTYDVTPVEYKTLRRFESEFVCGNLEFSLRLGTLLEHCKLQDINGWLRSVRDKVGTPLPVGVACSNMFDEHLRSFLHEDPKKLAMHYCTFYDLAERKRGWNTNYYGGEVTSSLADNHSRAARAAFDAENPNLALVLCAIKAVGPRAYPGQKQFINDPRADYSEGSYAVGNILCFDRRDGQFCTMDSWIGLEGYRELYKRITIFQDAASNFCNSIGRDAGLRSMMIKRLCKTL